MLFPVLSCATVAPLTTAALSVSEAVAVKTSGEELGEDVMVACGVVCDLVRDVLCVAMCDAV